MATSEILKEVRRITSEKIAEKQKSAENKYPSLLKKVKSAASLGETKCELSEHEVDEYSKRLLEADGFSVYITSKKWDVGFKYYPKGFGETVNVWIISW